MRLKTGSGAARKVRGCEVRGVRRWVVGAAVAVVAAIGLVGSAPRPAQITVQGELVYDFFTYASTGPFFGNPGQRLRLQPVCADPASPGGDPCGGHRDASCVVGWAALGVPLP